MSEEHEVKSHPEFFQARMCGLKPFEYRKNDRGYKPGDTLWEREWDPDAQKYTGREIRGTLILSVYSGIFGIPKGFAILGLESGSSELKSLRASLAEAEAQNAGLREYYYESCYCGYLNACSCRDGVGDDPDCPQHGRRVKNGEEPDSNVKIECEKCKALSRPRSEALKDLERRVEQKYKRLRDAVCEYEIHRWNESELAGRKYGELLIIAEFDKWDHSKSNPAKPGAKAARKGKEEG